MKTGLPIAVATVLALLAGSGSAGPLPTELGACAVTRISALGSRLDGVPDSGDAVEYANGGYGVSYDLVPALRAARVGDKVRLCLTAVPEDCPPGDDRGFVYRAEDQRTGGSWELPNAEHMCGGA